MLDTCPICKLWGGGIFAGWFRARGNSHLECRCNSSFDSGSSLSSCEHRAETFAVIAQLSLPLLPYVLIEMFVSTLLLLLLQSGMTLRWADFRAGKGTQLRCRSLCCGWEIGTCQLLVCWRTPEPPWRAAALCRSAEIWSVFRWSCYFYRWL